MSGQVLVAYATKMGATAEIAAAIGAELRKAGHQRHLPAPLATGGLAVDSRDWEQITEWAHDISATLSVTTSGSERPACSQRLPPTSSVPAGSEGTAPTPGAPDPPMPACRIRPETNSSA